MASKPLMEIGQVVEYLQLRADNNARVKELESQRDRIDNDSSDIMEYIRKHWNPHEKLLDQEFTLVQVDSKLNRNQVINVTYLEFLLKGELPYSTWISSGLRRDMLGRKAKIDQIRLEGFEEVPNGFKCHWSIRVIFKLKNGVDYGKQFYRFSFVDIVEKLP